MISYTITLSDRDEGASFLGERLVQVGNAELEVTVSYPSRCGLVFNWKLGPGEVGAPDRALCSRLPRVMGGTVRTISLLGGGGQTSSLLSGEQTGPRRTRVDGDPR